jgi:hypothetical protein
MATSISRCSCDSSRKSLCMRESVVSNDLALQFLLSQWEKDKPVVWRKTLLEIGTMHLRNGVGETQRPNQGPNFYQDSRSAFWDDPSSDCFQMSLCCRAAIVLWSRVLTGAEVIDLDISKPTLAGHSIWFDLGMSMLVVNHAPLPWHQAFFQALLTPICTFFPFWTSMELSKRPFQSQNLSWGVHSFRSGICTSLTFHFHVMSLSIIHESLAPSYLQLSRLWHGIWQELRLALACRCLYRYINF